MSAVALVCSVLAIAPPAVEPRGPSVLAPEELGRTKEPDRSLTFIGYFLTRAEVTNVAPTNDLFKGQVVGRLFGPNTTSTSSDKAFFFEQRFIPYFVYEPDITGDRARLRASFELDWTFGDTSNGAGGNFGSAISADQVNLQTQNLAIEVDIARGWSFNLGLQRLYDTVLDPYRTPVNRMQYTGERLAFWGTDAVGLRVQGREGEQRFDFGAYLLYENLIQRDDDVVLLEAGTDRHLGKTWHVGATFRYLRDSSQGQGGVGILGQGPDSQLADYMGAYRFTIPDETEQWRAHFAWLGVNTSYNPLFEAGRWAASGFAVGNFGQVSADVPGPASGFYKLANVLGLAANARVGFKYGRTDADHLAADLIYTSGDANGLEDGTYSGVVTGNTWAAPGAIFTSHGAYLLMPHANVVNRYYAAVADISNAGFGLMAATLNLSGDIIRNRLAAKLGGAAGASPVQPLGGGRFIGAELNARVSWTIRPFLDLEAHAAHLWLGDFYDSFETVVGEGPRPRNPWTAFLTLKWLMI